MSSLPETLSKASLPLPEALSKASLLLPELVEGNQTIWHCLRQAQATVRLPSTELQAMASYHERRNSYQAILEIFPTSRTWKTREPNPITLNFQIT